MSLRARLATVLTVVLVLVTGLAIAVVVVQRGRLIDQLDDRLATIAPLERPQDEAPPPRVDPTGDPGRNDPPATLGSARRPISDVYIATVRSDGSLDVIIQGQLLDQVVDTSDFDEPPSGRSFSTVDSADGSETFRVLSEPTPDGLSTTVIAVPTNDIDQTIRRLIITFALVAAAIALTLGALAWWVWRLSLIPLARITDTADAIASGERDQRVPELSDTTEAGRMAKALNTMLDQRDEADDRLRQFVSDASHELRTPLTSIQGYLEIYSAGGFREPAEMDDAVRRMTDESERMRGLVENLLNLARMDEEQPLVLDATDIGELVRDVCADMGTAHQGRSVTAAAPARGEVVVQADNQKVRQMLVGLVDNALVHGPDASVEVTVSTAGEHLILSVIDDGPGMTAEEASRVFDRFYRGDSSRSRLRGGTGLGLAIARIVAEQHGGDIALTTAPNRGSTFAITLPLTRP